VPAIPYWLSLYWLIHLGPVPVRHRHHRSPTDSQFFSILLIHEAKTEMASSSGLPFPHPRRLPNEAEVQQCKAIIIEVDKDINALELQVEKLNGRLQDLKRKRANHVSYLAPFRRLPVEILCKIGMLCLQNDRNVIKITSIHSSLRDAMIGNQTLWRHIRLIEAKSSKHNDKQVYNDDDERHDEDEEEYNNDEVENDEDEDEDLSDSEGDDEEKKEDDDDDNREAPFTYHYWVSLVGKECSVSDKFLDWIYGM
jgi:hypothetical protein